jgi:hypothetical protein
MTSASLRDLSCRIHALIRSQQVRNQFCDQVRACIAKRVRNPELSLPLYLFEEEWDVPEEPREITLAEKYTILAVIHDFTYENDGPIMSYGGFDHESRILRVLQLHVQDNWARHAWRVEGWYNDVVTDLAGRQHPTSDPASMALVSAHPVEAISATTSVQTQPASEQTGARGLVTTGQTMVDSDLHTIEANDDAEQQLHIQKAAERKQQQQRRAELLAAFHGVCYVTDSPDDFALKLIKDPEFRRMYARRWVDLGKEMVDKRDLLAQKPEELTNPKNDFAKTFALKILAGAVSSNEAKILELLDWLAERSPDLRYSAGQWLRHWLQDEIMSNPSPKVETSTPLAEAAQNVPTRPKGPRTPVELPQLLTCDLGDIIEELHPEEAALLSWARIGVLKGKFPAGWPSMWEASEWWAGGRGGEWAEIASGPNPNQWLPPIADYMKKLFGRLVTGDELISYLFDHQGGTPADWEKLTLSQLAEFLRAACKSLGSSVAAAPQKRFANGAMNREKPLRVLHLSDLHFAADTSPSTKLRWLADDIQKGDGFGFEQLDYLVISGDMTHKGNETGLEKAREFVSLLIKEFGISADRCIFVPGNHDVQDRDTSYDFRQNNEGVKPEHCVSRGSGFLVRNEANYPQRLKLFSDLFFKKIRHKPYPLDSERQGLAYLFPETRIQFLTLNSCWQIDQHFRKRSGVHPSAVAQVIREADQQIKEARISGALADRAVVLRVGVWHHAVSGPGQMGDLDFLEHLMKNNVRIGLHGDVHELRRDLVSYWHKDRIHIVGSGSFAAGAEGRPESTPRLYNLLEIQRDLGSVRVHTRCQLRSESAWRGWNEWQQDNGPGALPFFDIVFKAFS